MCRNIASPIKINSKKVHNHGCYPVFHEFSRRARQMDFSVLKAQEMRNILLFLFPIILQCIENNAPERKIWLFLSFIERATILPDDQYAEPLPL